jgi:transcriptional regulator with XRE-family HTH domain
MMVAEERDVKFSAILAGLLSAPEQAVSRKKLAGHLGVNEATVSHYVHGRSNPSFEALVGIAGFFNVSLDFLVFGERPPTAVVDDPAGVRAEIRRAVLDSRRGRQAPGSRHPHQQAPAGWDRAGG